jgi:cellulase
VWYVEKNPKYNAIQILIISKVHIKVTGSGSAALPAGVAIPGAYKATDAGILFDIYSGFSSYPIPGPKLWNGASSGSTPATPTTTKAATPTTTKAATPAATKPATTTKAAVPTTPAKTTLATVAKPAPTAGSGSGAAVQKWGQCGGKGFTGATACVSGSTCKVQNDYYSQCL